MHRLSKETIDSMRRLKQEGLSLNELACKFNCAKSTASLYCRDVFRPNDNEGGSYRKYHSEKDARHAIIDCKRNRPHKKYPHKKLFPCVSCGNLIEEKSKMCIRCHNTKRKEDALLRHKVQIEAKQLQKFIFPRKRKQVQTEKEQKGLSAFSVEICSFSPTQRHHWILDSNNHGICKYCNKEKDYNVQTKKDKIVVLEVNR